jgi:hypothetical protein
MFTENYIRENIQVNNWRRTPPSVCLHSSITNDNYEDFDKQKSNIKGT